MRAGWRLVVMAFVAGLSVPPAMLHAQEAEPATNAPAEAIGPRELENFDLRGTVTREADPVETLPPPRSATAPSGARRSETASSQSTANRAQADADRSRPAAEESRRETAAAVTRAAPPPAPRTSQPVRSSITVDLPPARVASASVQFPDGDPAAAAALSPDQGPSLWPWLLAALALGAGGAVLFWRRTTREAFAGGPHVDSFVAPTPVPARPRAQPQAPEPSLGTRPVPSPPVVTPPPAPTGIVATRLRPWLDVEFEPERCIIEEERVIFEFELDVANSGTVPATDVRVGIQFFNATPEQDQELAAFFAAAGEDANRAPDIAPDKRFELKPQLVVPRERLRILEAGGRQFFVPLIGISIRYGSGYVEGQSAAGFLIGRDNDSDKLAPLRVDLGARIYRGLGARILPGNIRR